MGLGHLIRCIALGHMLKDCLSVTFVCQSIPEKIRAELAENGFHLKVISVESDFLNQVGKADVVVLDGYHFDSHYQQKVKEKGATLVCIDDLHDKEFYADLIINHAPGIKSEDYQSKSYTQFALGPEYALLRPSFLEQARKQRAITQIETVLICFGGSDHNNLTESTLRIVSEFIDFKYILVITGSAYKHLDSLSPILNKDPRIKHFHAQNEDQMLTHISRSELAIVPASGLLYEVLSAGCRVISGTNADNQKLLYTGMLSAHSFESASRFQEADLKGALNKVLTSSNSPKKIIDGKSKGRIIEKIFGLIFSIRSVREDDCQLLFTWANDKDVRSNSIAQASIEWEDHIAWFKNKIASVDSKLFIMEYRGMPVGQIRYDRKDDHWLIDYSIDKAHRSKGLGKLMIKNTLTHLNSERITALVKTGNIGSIKSFESLLFNEKKELVIDGETYKVFELNDEIHTN